MPLFGSDLLLKKTAKTKKVVLEIVDPVLKAIFRPEFLNRVDEILPFLPLQLSQVAKRLHDRHIALSWDPSVVAYLAEEGYEPAFGAHPLRRLIQREVVNLFASGILENKIPPHSALELHAQENRIRYEVAQ